MLAVYRYQTADGIEPITQWMSGLRDSKIRARIEVRLARLAAGNFGDYKSVREGVMELRIDCGPGYRVYFARPGDAVVLLLCGGDKHKQNTDIRLAIEYWQDFKRRQQ